MKRGDRRALERAARLLPVNAGEELLEFDVGNLYLNILPRDFPYPLSNKIKRIDLVASDRALYIHAGGDVVRLEWSEILALSLTETSVISWLRRDGHKEQVHVSRGPRQLATVVTEHLRLFEAALEKEERDERERLRSEYARRDRLREERRVILDNDNQHLRALSVRGSVFLLNGDEFIGGTVALENSGIRFLTKDLHQVIVPYVRVHGLREDENGNAVAAIEDDLYTSFRVEVSEKVQISEWINDVTRLIQIGI